MGSWGCPHEVNGICQKVNKLACDPGMKGCVLYGRFVFSNPAKTGRSNLTPETYRRERRAAQFVGIKAAQTGLFCNSRSVVLAPTDFRPGSIDQERAERVNLTLAATQRDADRSRSRLHALARSPFGSQKRPFH